VTEESKRLFIKEVPREFCEKHCAAWNGKGDRAWCGASLFEENKGLCLWLLKEMQQKMNLKIGSE